MLAVVGHDPIAALAQPRSRSFHHFTATEAARFTSYADAVAAGETFKRNVFHRSAPHSVCEARVVNDATVTHIDAMVRVERPRRDEMGRKPRLFSGPEQTIARGRMLSEAAGAACMMRPP